jgi:hypothetical protein
LGLANFNLDKPIIGKNEEPYQNANLITMAAILD